VSSFSRLPLGRSRWPSNAASSTIRLVTSTYLPRRGWTLRSSRRSSGTRMRIRLTGFIRDAARPPIVLFQNSPDRRDCLS